MIIQTTRYIRSILFGFILVFLGCSAGGGSAGSGAEFKGTVVDLESGLPLANIMIVIEETGAIGVTMPDGSYSIESTLPDTGEVTFLFDGDINGSPITTAAEPVIDIPQDAAVVSADWAISSDSTVELRYVETTRRPQPRQTPRRDATQENPTPTPTLQPTPTAVPTAAPSQSSTTRIVISLFEVGLPISDFTFLIVEGTTPLSEISKPYVDSRNQQFVEVSKRVPKRAEVCFVRPENSDTEGGSEQPTNDVVEPACYGQARLPARVLRARDNIFVCRLSRQSHIEVRRGICRSGR